MIQFDDYIKLDLTTNERRSKYLCKYLIKRCAMRQRGTTESYAKKMQFLRVVFAQRPYKSFLLVINGHSEPGATC